MEEIWKDVAGFEGLYQVSNLGNVRNSKGKILKQATSRNGYKRIFLHKNGYAPLLVHRLVASAFIDNPQNKPCVNHIDNDRANNLVDNLEWVTYKENMMWASSQGRMVCTEEKKLILRKRDEERGLSVIGTDKKGNEYLFVVMNDVKKLGFQPTKVSLCCKGRRKTSGNMTWRFVGKEILKTMKPSTMTLEEATKIRNGHYVRKEKAI